MSKDDPRKERERQEDYDFLRERVRKLRPAHIEQHTARVPFRLFGSLLQRQMQQDFLALRVCDFCQCPASGCGRQYRKRHRTRQIHCAFSNSKPVPEIVNDDGNTRRVSRQVRERGKAQRSQA